LLSSRSIAVLVLLFKRTQKSVSIPGTQVRLWDARRELYHPFCNFVGSVCSPPLANIFLHEILDAWYERDVKPRMKGRTFLLRFADDFVIGGGGAVNEFGWLMEVRPTLHVAVTLTRAADA
jgi:hypothetical protein